jgi:hypothetical protein
MPKLCAYNLIARDLDPWVISHQLQLAVRTMSFHAGHGNDV